MTLSYELKDSFFFFLFLSQQVYTRKPRLTRFPF
jgi:hypothetical protein